MPVYSCISSREERDACEAASRDAWERRKHTLAMFAEIVPIEHAGDPMFNLWSSARSSTSQLLSSTPDGDEVLHAHIPGNQDTQNILIRSEYKVVWDAALKCFWHGYQEFETNPNEKSDGCILDGVGVTNGLQPESIGFFLTGQRGIGKSMWLWYALFRCLQERLTVVYQAQPGWLWIFNACGVFKVDVTRYPNSCDLSECLPSTTWCLVDASPSFLDLPDPISESGHFFVHAAAPGAACKAWMRKFPSPIVEFFMKPPSLRELTVIWKLQSCYVPGRDPIIKEHYLCYGPSARDACLSAAENGCSSKERLIQKLAAMSRLPDFFEHLRKVVDPDLIDDGDKLFGHILLVAPSHRRDLATVRLVSQHIISVLATAFATRWLTPAQALYDLLYHVEGAATQSRSIFAAAVHRALPHGGIWNLSRLQELPGKVWSTPNPASANPDCIIVAPGPMSVWIGDRLSCAPSRTGQLETIAYNPRTALSLQAAYYVPKSCDEPAFDSFIYDMLSHTVTVFQVVVSQVCVVEAAGMEWLCSLRSPRWPDREPRLQYIVTTPHNNVKLVGSPELSSLLMGVWHLRCPTLPRPLPNRCNSRPAVIVPSYLFEALDQEDQ